MELCECDRITFDELKPGDKFHTAGPTDWISAGLKRTHSETLFCVVKETVKSEDFLTVRTLPYGEFSWAFEPELFKVE